MINISPCATTLEEEEEKFSAGSGSIDTLLGIQVVHNAFSDFVGVRNIGVKVENLRVLTKFRRTLFLEENLHI